jgi:hypothetical protein
MADVMAASEMASVFLRPMAKGPLDVEARVIFFSPNCID